MNRRLMYHEESDCVFEVFCGFEYLTFLNQFVDDVTNLDHFESRYESERPERIKNGMQLPFWALVVINGAVKREGLRQEIKAIKRQIKELKKDLEAAENLVDNYAYVTGMTIPEIESRVKPRTRR